MSGGYFAYNQYWINCIADRIERVLNRQGKEKPKDELFCDKEYYEKHPDEKYHYHYPKIVQEKMREAVTQLRKAAVYAQRVDWFLSGDDSEERFIERLSEELGDAKNTTMVGDENGNSDLGDVGSITLSDDEMDGSTELCEPERCEYCDMDGHWKNGFHLIGCPNGMMS